MHGRLEIAAAEELEGVGDVDDDGGRIRAHVFPAGLRAAVHLEACDGLVEEEGEGVVVLVGERLESCGEGGEGDVCVTYGVAASPDVVELGVFRGGAWVVEHVAEILETLGVVAVPLHEVLLVDFEDVGEEA